MSLKEGVEGGNRGGETISTLRLWPKWHLHLDVSWVFLNPKCFQFSIPSPYPLLSQPQQITTIRCIQTWGSSLIPFFPYSPLQASANPLDSTLKIYLEPICVSTTSLPTLLQAATTSHWNSCSPVHPFLFLPTHRVCQCLSAQLTTTTNKYLQTNELIRKGELGSTDKCSRWSVQPIPRLLWLLWLKSLALRLLAAMVKKQTRIILIKWFFKRKHVSLLNEKSSFLLGLNAKNNFESFIQQMVTGL